MLAKRPLGKTGLEVPVLGFGVSGPLGSPLVTEAQTVSLIHTAHAGGASLFDTAPFYGMAEARLGKALKNLPRDSFCLCVKAGTRREKGRVIKDFSEAGLRASLSASLARLGVDHVDIFLLHGPIFSDLTPALRQTLEAMKAEGLFRAAGICGRDTEILVAIERGFAAVIQAPVFGGLNGKTWPEIAQAAGAGFLGIETMRGAAADLRPIRRPADLWYAARGLRNGAASGKGVPATALARALASPGVSGIVASTTRKHHLTANLAVAAETR